jgi:hypothetical protein
VEKAVKHGQVTVAMPLCESYIPEGLARKRKWPYTMRNQRLTAERCGQITILVSCSYVRKDDGLFISSVTLMFTDIKAKHFVSITGYKLQTAEFPTDRNLIA